MKEYRTSQKNSKSKIDENDDLGMLFGNDDSIDNKINKDLKEIKEKLNSEKLSDEFKANLTAKLKEELNKTEDSNKGKIIKFPTFTRRLAGICACFVFLFLGCIAHADDIENVILELFGNTDRIIANAIEEGNYREIEMDYVEDNGISIKVDYVVVEDDNLYIAFNVLGQYKIDKLLLGDMKIYDGENKLLYTETTDVEAKSSLTIKESRISKNNLMLIYKLTKIKEELKNVNMINFEINNLYVINDNTNINKIRKMEF